MTAYPDLHIQKEKAVLCESNTSQIFMHLGKTCPAVPVLEKILEELRAVHSELQEKNCQIRRKSTVSEQIKMLLKEFPRPDWSSAELARKIGNGCSGAAVRQTAIWKSYRKMQRMQQTECAYKDFVTDDIY